MPGLFFNKIAHRYLLLLKYITSPVTGTVSVMLIRGVMESHLKLPHSPFYMFFFLSGDWQVGTGNDFLLDVESNAAKVNTLSFIYPTFP